MKIQPESEICSHITLTSVINGLFHTRYLHYIVSTRGRVTHRVKLVVGATHTPSLRKVAVKTRKLKSLARLL